MTLNFATGGLRDTVTTDQYNRIRREFVLFGDRDTNRFEGTFPIMFAATINLTNNHKVFSIPSRHRKRSRTTTTSCWIAAFDGCFDILWISVNAADDDHVLQATTNEQLALVHEA